jgi:PiT family inorganic phosphate transporter
VPFPPEILLIIVVALIFDFINGFHDAANSIATVVSTRVLSPKVAVVWAAFFNFAAFLVLKTHVAQTIGKGVIDPAVITPHILLAGVMGAIVWNLITWWLGLPTSSSHALIGGFVGAALVGAGPHSVLVPGVIKIAEFIVISPLVGMVLGWFFMMLMYFLFRNSTPRRVDKLFRRLQLFSAAAFSLGHGGNDAQKTMGIITALLYSTGHLTGEFHVPLWVVLSSHAAIGLGTMSGGWRIVKTMGMKLTKLQPVGGFCAETAGAITLFATTLAGIPVSTTHTITGAIVGVGSTRGLSAVKWGIARRIVWAWVLTMPMAAIVAAVCYYLVRLIHY